MQPSNAGHRGKTNWLWLIKWKRNSKIKSAKSRTAAACGALERIFKTMTKFIFIFFVCFVCQCCNQPTQDKKNFQKSLIITPFNLSIVTYNHATQLLEGRFKFNINENKLEIHQFSVYLNKYDTILFSRVLKSDSILERISNLNLDTLRDLYYNKTVLPTSGNEMEIEYNKQGTVKKIYLHSYYNTQIGIIISLANGLIPNEYKIKYNN